LALNTQGATAGEIDAFRKEHEAELGVPVVAVLEEGVHFVQKPFSKQELAAKVRTALDER